MLITHVQHQHQNQRHHVGGDQGLDQRRVNVNPIPKPNPNLAGTLILLYVPDHTTTICFPHNLFIL